MFSLFRAVIDRLKALFATDAALTFEAELLARHAERKADLLRQATRYDAEGLQSVANDIRQHVEGMKVGQPLASVQNALEGWNAANTPEALPLRETALPMPTALAMPTALPMPTAENNPPKETPQPISGRKKNRR